MESKVQESILSIQQWKAQAGIVNGVMRKGWDVSAGDLVGIDDPLTFYVCEPLKSGFAAFAVIDRPGFESLVASGIEKYGAEADIFAAVSAVTDALIEKPAAADGELLDAVVTGNLIIFASSVEASQLVEAKTYQKFGIIAYKNPADKDDLIGFRAMRTMERIDFGELYTSVVSDAALARDKAAYTVSIHLQRDAHLLPRHFEGVNALDAACEFAGKVGVDLPILWEA